jgi:hypothetical protein
VSAFVQPYPTLAIFLLRSATVFDVGTHTTVADRIQTWPHLCCGLLWFFKSMICVWLWANDLRIEAAGCMTSVSLANDCSTSNSRQIPNDSCFWCRQ